jgi:aminoglycoside phosphotransferase (APT) family kinase protein
LRRVRPGVFHGDLNFGNVLWADDGLPPLKAIDWREDFAGCVWGDLRYDRAKLMAGCVVHWERARRGDFTPWKEGERYLRMFRDAWQDPSIEVIAALSLLNSAPLHAAPLDEVLVARGTAWLQEVIK